MNPFDLHLISVMIGKLVTTLTLIATISGDLPPKQQFQEINRYMQTAEQAYPSIKDPEDLLINKTVDQAIVGFMSAIIVLREKNLETPQ